MADRIDLSRLSALPAPWSGDLHLRGPWRATSLLPEGAESDCRVSEKRAGAPVIFVAGACSSAMPLAWHFAAMGCLPNWGSVICIQQREGKGQLGRIWVSPPGNLYAAIRMPLPPTAFSGMMSLVAGYAVANVLRELGIPAALKWPNDILLDGKKVGGILVQNRSGISVAGIGINLLSAPPPELLRAGHAMAATSLSKEGYPAAPLPLWERIVDRSRIYFNEILNGDVPTAILSIQAHMAFRGHVVQVDDHTGRAPYRATLVGLSEDGSLVLQTQNSKETIRSGSIIPLPDS